MDKILIVSFYDCANFGNRLQTYALNTIISNWYHNVPVNLVYRWKRQRITDLKLLLKACLAIVGIPRFKGYMHVLRKRILLENWSNKHMPFQVKIGSKYKNTKYINDAEYRFVVTGSDQVWHNFHRQNNELEYYYLSFIPEIKRVSFAPSFGRDVIPEEDVDLHVSGLKKMHFLSCREISGCKIIHELTGRDACLLPDPTLCLSADQWRELIKNPEDNSKSTSKFAVLYFLGGCSVDLRNKIKNYCDDKQLEIIDLGSRFSPNIAIDPGQFISLIDEAECVFTDSFHASVFSIIFLTSFIVFPRGGSWTMFDRIVTLLDRFGLSNRICYEKELELYDFNEMERTKILTELKSCQQDAKLYLDKAFETIVM